jgi:hypothetical protein
MRQRPHLPAGHGELLTSPDFSEWADIAAANHAASSTWDAPVGGTTLGELRVLARSEALAAGEEYSARLGIAHAAPGDPEGLLVATGHQPEIYHPGVWVKDFLLQRLQRETSSTAVDIVVDTDGFDSVEIKAPCFTPEVSICRQFLSVGATDTAYCLATVPTTADLDTFCEAGAQMLASLPAPAVRRHFSAFCDALRDVIPRCGNMAELITAARRRFELPAGTDYLELPVSEFGESFLRLAASIALDARRFVAVYNDQLAEYRVLTKTRSTAQPFPDLAEKDGLLELPFWYLDGHRRVPLWARPLPDAGVELFAEDRVVAVLPGDFDGATAALVRLDTGAIAPKAVMLTLYLRLFVADLFIHGVGGGRYDRVTDGVIRAYFGIEPPRFVVASLTMYLPLGAHVVTDDEIAEAKEQLNRLEHNPDALLGEVDFDDDAQMHRALALADEKRELVAAIATPGADKKAIGARIREINALIGQLLEPIRVAMQAELYSLEGQRADSEILTDRTYPFCLWSPLEIADKVW